VLPMDGPVPEDLDGLLTAAARLAQAGDVVARDQLSDAFAPSIRRLARRFGGPSWGAGPVWDSDDLEQEGYLILLDLVAGWPGGESFVAYALARLPWRLRNAVRRLNGPRPLRAVGVEIDHLADEMAAGAEAVVLLEELARSLPSPEGAILLWRIRDGETSAAIALRLGIDRRTVTRCWQRLLVTVRKSLQEGQDHHAIISEVTCRRCKAS
jgi:RNA polymerase sigma factor (sigma-70 family)